MKKLDTERIAGTVAETLGPGFENMKILKVNVAPGTDPDGNDLLRVEVVVEGTVQRADARHIASAVRRLRPALDEMGVDLFPLMSYISKSDYESKLDGERGRRRETV
jgi:hypothetical protein